MVIYGNNLAEKLFGVALSKDHLRLATPYCELVDDPDFAVDVDLAVDFHAGIEGDMSAVRRSVETLVLNSSLLDWSTINFYVDKMKVHPYFKDEIRRINSYFSDPNFPNFKDESSFGTALRDAARDCVNSPCNVFSATSDSIGRLAQPASTKTSENVFDVGDLKGTTTNLIDGLDQAVFNDIPGAFQQGIIELTSVTKEAWSSTQEILMGKANISEAISLAKSSGSMRSSITRMYNYTPDIKSFFDFDQMSTAILTEISNTLGGCFDKFQHAYRYNPYIDNMSTPLGIDVRQVNGVSYHTDPGGTYTVKGMTPPMADIYEPAGRAGSVEVGSSGSFIQVGKGDVITKNGVFWISKPLVGTNAPVGGSWPYLFGGFVSPETNLMILGVTGDSQIDSGDTGIEGVDKICPGNPVLWVEASEADNETEALDQAVQLKDNGYIVDKISNNWSHDISAEGLARPVAPGSKIFNDGAIINKAMIDRLEVTSQGLKPLNTDIVKNIQDGRLFITVRQTNNCTKIVKVIGYKDNVLFPDAAFGLTPAAYTYVFGQYPIGALNQDKTQSFGVGGTGWGVYNTRSVHEGNTAVRMAIGDYDEIKAAIEDEDNGISCGEIEIDSSWRDYFGFETSVLNESNIGSGGSRTDKENRAFEKLNPKLVKGLIHVSTAVGQKLKVTSGYRSPAYNKSVGGATGSQHLLGNAADVLIKGIGRRQLINAVESYPDFKNGGIGKYNSFIHMDVRNYVARW